MKEATEAAFEQYNRKVATGRHRFIMHYRHDDYAILSIKISVPINEAIRASSKFLTASILYKIRENTNHIPDNYSVFISERPRKFIDWLVCRSNKKLYNYNMHLLVQIPWDLLTCHSRNAVAPMPKVPPSNPN
jgi:hypothetical protein